MTQEKRNKNCSGKAADSTGKGFGHWVRVAVMCVSGGFIFPHAMTECDDKDTKVKTQ
jgi:hypothetical protein